MKKKAFIIFILIPFLYSCASTFGTTHLGSKVKKLELGMSKQEVIAIMGKTYDKVSAVQTDGGNLEIIRYIGTFPPNYVLHFLDDNLVEWFER